MKYTIGSDGIEQGESDPKGKARPRLPGIL